MKKRLHIGLDFDDVIFDMGTSFIAYRNRCYGTSYKREDMYTYRFEDIWDCTSEDIFRLFQSYINDSEHRDALPLKDAFESIKELVVSHDVSIVTGRQETARASTESWLRKYMPELIERLHFANSFGEEKERRSKGEICRELGIDVFVEDAPVHIGNIAVSVPHVLLFDAPWNRNLTELPENVDRISSWKDAKEKIANLLV